ncbi:MAG: GIY-YIG nuclease family protein [Armatimonadetes bacterium]|nr:GIY-YIG nuclease family protein [Armatimonadota bacterium]
MAIPLPRQRAARARALSQVPQAPGVYMFLDARGDILYIGKSTRLRDRVRSYFAGRPATRKLRRLRSELAGVDWQVTTSEIEALLLESRLIKRHQPRFNALLRVFSPRPYLRVDAADPFPRLEVTRAPTPDGARYFGPFGNAEALDTAARALSDALGLRTCAMPGHRLPGTSPCYRLDLGLCLAPCARREAAALYPRAVTRAIAAIRGRDRGALRALVSRMQRAAERLDFEQARLLRDGIAELQAGIGQEATLQTALAARAVLIACEADAPTHVRLLGIVGGRLHHYSEEEIALLADPAQRARQSAALAALCWAASPPQGVLLAEILDEVQIVAAWLRQRRQLAPPLALKARCQPAARCAQVERWLAGISAGGAAHLDERSRAA